MNLICCENILEVHCWPGAWVKQNKCAVDPQYESKCACRRPPDPFWKVIYGLNAGMCVVCVAGGAGAPD